MAVVNQSGADEVLGNGAPGSPATPGWKYTDWGSGSWRNQAACRGTDPELFLPAGRAAVERAHEAKAVCQSCGVRAACLQFGLETNQAGIWGGTTDDERGTIRRAWLAERRRRNGLRGSSSL